MKVLELTLNKKWFDMIAKGIKTEEYRKVPKTPNNKLKSLRRLSWKKN